MQAHLTCDACQVTDGSYSSYEEWSDRATALGWVIGEDVVICSDCLGRASNPLAEPAVNASDRSAAPSTAERSSTS